MSLTIDQLAAVAGGSVDPVDAGATAVTGGIAISAQEVADGGLFAAVPGTRVHGATYAGQSAGSAVLTDRVGLELLRAAGDGQPALVVDDVRAVLGAVSDAIYASPSTELTVIGVTGTSGKTTTTYLLEGALMAAGRKVGLIGTTGTRIDGRKVPSKLTTPEAPALHGLFRTMVDEGVTHVVMEVSSHALMLGRVDGIHFDATGFLNLSQDHLDFHSTMDEYFEAKALLFDPASPLHAPETVICVDDEWGRQMAKRARGEGVHVSTVSVTSSDATWHVSGGWVADNGVQHVELEGDVAKQEIDVSLPGAFNVSNAAVAWALLESIDCATEQAREGMGRVAVPGRMERIDCGQDFLAVVDYAHKPAALGAVLDTLRRQTKNRIIAVIGAGGDRDVTKRPLMGAEAARGADVVIITDDNPRSEDPAIIRQAVYDGALEANTDSEIHNIGDRAEAIRAAVAAASTGDAVVVAGKGHETGQEIAGVIHDFDDRIELREALKGRPE